MVRFEVIAYNGQAPLVELACEFGESGGNIGRADGNTMVLPDPERLISRVHAAVLFREGQYFIRALSSSNPLMFNGVSLENGRTAILRTGDEVGIGAYVLRIHTSGATAAAPPLREASDGLLDSSAQPSADNPFADLLAPISPEPAAERPSSVLAEAPRAKAKPAPAPAPADDSPRFIPDDFDPFAAPPSKSPARLPDDLDLGIDGSSAKRSIDEMFDLRPNAGTDPGMSPVVGPGVESLGGMSVDPMEAIGAVVPRRPPTGLAQRDDAPEMYASFRMPKATADPVSDVQREIDSPSRQVVPAKQDVAPASERQAAQRESAPEPRGTPARSMPSEGQFGNAVPSAEVKVPVPLVAPVPTPPGSPVASTSSETEQLLREFLSGAGVPGINVPGGMTPKLMNAIGQLLRESTHGTLDLLRARALLKHEMRAAMTMIAENENNPLKFSPNVDAAMTHLLSPQGQGFMTPLRAMKDAYEDLRAHEIAFMAGMRAALAGVLARFDPATLEPRLSESSLMDKILPVNRRAKRWDVFVGLYEQLSREAEDDFHALFGKEFLRAYAAQIAQLSQDEKSDTAGDR